MTGSDDDDEGGEVGTFSPSRNSFTGKCKQCVIHGTIQTFLSSTSLTVTIESSETSTAVHRSGRGFSASRPLFL